MWTRSSSRPPAPVPISDAVPGRRRTNSRDPAAEGDPPGRPIGATGLALVLGIVLMAAALLLPSSDAPDAVPSDGLQPVVAATTDLAAERVGASQEPAAGAATPLGERWAAIDGATKDGSAVGGDGHGGETDAADAAGDPDGSSSASVAGDDIERASREEAQRQRASRRRAKTRRAARAREAARAKRDRSRARRPPSAPPAASSAAPPTPAAPPAPQAPPRAVSPEPARSAPPRRSPSKDSPSREFGGGL